MADDMTHPHDWFASAHEDASAFKMLKLYYSEDADQFFLVSMDETTALPLPRDLQGHWAEIAKPQADRLNCHSGFVPWPLCDTEPK